MGSPVWARPSDADNKSTCEVVRGKATTSRKTSEGLTGIEGVKVTPSIWLTGNALGVPILADETQKNG